MVSTVTAGDAAAKEQFVGREAQLAALEAALAGASRGRGSLFLIGGEPGIGKSRLADNLSQRAHEAGAHVLWGKCWDGAGAPAYWPWIQALRTHIRNTDRLELERQLGGAATDVVRMLPELTELVGQLPAPGPETDASRFQLFDSTTDFLRRITIDTPTVLILDDLHSADTPSILLLQFVARQLADMRVVLIGTYRDIELTPEHPLTHAIQEMTREPTTRLLTLRGMSEAEVGRLIEMTTGRPAPASVASRLWRSTSGNPLFVGEAVRLLAPEGRLDEDAAAAHVQFSLPAGVREVIARRAEKLSEPAGRALRHGAAIGPEFSADLLRRIGTSDDDVSAALAEAVKSGLAVAVGAGRYRFSHDLVREALYEEIEPTERLALHRQIADALEQMQPAGPGSHAAELAYHYFAVAEGGSAQSLKGSQREVAQKAEAYARLAADQAAAALAYEEASRLYQRAIDALELTEEPDELRRIDLLLSRGEAEGRAGDLDVTREVFFKAATLARNAGMPILLARAALGYSGRLKWARAGSDTRVVPLLQEALLLLGGDDDQLRVRLLTRLACSWRSNPERRPLSDALSAQAVELARRLDDPATLAYALIGRFYATWWPENVDERAALAAEISELAKELGDGELLVEASLLIWLSFTEMGRMSEARQRVEEVRRLTVQLRQPTHMWLGIGGTQVPDALLTGQFSLASTYMAEESDIPHPITFPRDELSAYRMHLFMLHREIGGLAEFEGIVRAAVDEFPWYPCHRPAYVLTLLAVGRPAEARAAFTSLARDRFAALYRDNEWLLGMAMASDACGQLNDAQAAAELMEQLAPFSGRHAMGHAEGSVGAVDRYLGVLATVLGRYDDAERYFLRAQDTNEQMGARPWLAHTQADYAQMLRARQATGDAAKAAQLEAAALEAARSMGMTVLAGRLTAGIGDEPPLATKPSPLPPADAVFRREGEYWTIGFGGDSLKLRDSKGLGYISRLLAQPGREFLALDLAREAAESPRSGAEAVDASLSEGGMGDAGSQLDADAKAAYRARLHELQADLDEAESANDPERADKAREEMEFLGRELARAVGLSGRDRVAGSASERARLSVTRAIRLALDRIVEHSSALGEHLNSTIRTGTYCSYRPDTRLAIDWQT